MKKIKYFPVFLCIVCLVAACGNEPSETSTEPVPDKTAETAQMTAPETAADQAADAVQSGDVDQSFIAGQAESYTKVLQGKWQSQGDGSITMEINGNTVKHLKNGKVVRETTIEIDTECKSVPCEGGFGWCFVEKSAGKTQCNNIRQVDMKLLHYKILGDNGGDMTYNKLQ